MLIDLSYMGLLTIDPSQYKTTLVVSIDAPDDHPGCGVLAGRYDPFTESEQNKFLPVFRDEDYGLKLYLLDRPESKAKPNLISRWHYAAIGWSNAVYVEYPYSYEIILQELSNADGLIEWSVSVSGRRGSFRVVLPDYKPGTLIRGMPVVGFFVQRANDEGFIRWVSDSKACATLEEAKQYAKDLPIGDQVEALRIVDANGKVFAWVGRNGYVPGGALPPIR